MTYEYISAEQYRLLNFTFKEIIIKVSIIIYHEIGFHEMLYNIYIPANILIWGM